MKCPPPPRSSRAQTTKLPEPAETPSRTELTGDTITDFAIRELLFDARREGEVDVAVNCSKALAPKQTRTTTQAVLQRLKARKACAAEINRRADQWRRMGTPEYHKYVRLQKTQQHHETPHRAANDSPPRRKGRKRTLKYTCCWYCNDPFEFGNYITVQARIGSVIVHRDCVIFLVRDGLMEDPDGATADSDPGDE